MRTLLLLLLSCLTAAASPFLVCAPVSTSAAAGTVPASYSITVDGNSANPIVSPAVTIAVGTVQLHADLSGLANGSHTVTVLATNSAGFSGPLSAPFTFSLPAAVPAAPAQFSLSPN